MKHVTEQAFHLEALRVDRNNTQITHSVSRAYITSTSQHNQSDNSTVMFEGLEIRSTLLPTLQKVRRKKLKIGDFSMLQMLLLWLLLLLMVAAALLLLLL